MRKHQTGPRSCRRALAAALLPSPPAPRMPADRPAASRRSRAEPASSCAAVVPSQPTSVVATIGASNKRTVSVAFTASAGSPTGYVLYSIPSGGNSPVIHAATTSPIVWSGGSGNDGVAYTFYMTGTVRRRSSCRSSCCRRRRPPLLPCSHAPASRAPADVSLVV